MPHCLSPHVPQRIFPLRQRLPARENRNQNLVHVLVCGILGFFQSVNYPTRSDSGNDKRLEHAADYFGLTLRDVPRKAAVVRREVAPEYETIKLLLAHSGADELEDVIPFVGVLGGVALPLTIFSSFDLASIDLASIV
jgi:hypothetical protein